MLPRKSSPYRKRRLSVAQPTSDAEPLHHVIVDGLAPGTTYFYEVEGAQGSFRTAPSTIQPFRFAVPGDIQYWEAICATWQIDANSFSTYTPQWAIHPAIIRNNAEPSSHTPLPSIPVVRTQ